MRGSPDAVLTPSLTFPTLNLTGVDLPHISSSTGRVQEYWLTHTHNLTHTDTAQIHFSGSFPLSVCASLSPHLPPHLFPSALGKPVHYSVSVNTHKYTHTAGRLCGSGVWRGSRALPTSKCNAAIMIAHYGSQGPCL